MLETEVEAEAELNEQGVDLNASAKLKFEDGSTAIIASATNIETNSDVIITDGNNTLTIDQPWHCGEFKGRKSSLIFTKDENEPVIIDIQEKLGVFTHEIDHFTGLLESGSLESPLMSHADSLGNMTSLDNWRSELGVKYLEDQPETRPSNLFLDMNKGAKLLMPSSKLKGIEIKPSRLVFGCDNQINSNHAFLMFDHFFSLGGNIFDTAYIYAHKVLGHQGFCSLLGNHCFQEYWHE